MTTSLKHEDQALQHAKLWRNLGPLDSAGNRLSDCPFVELIDAAFKLIEDVNCVFGWDEGYIGSYLNCDQLAWNRLCRTMHGQVGQFGGNADSLAESAVRLHAAAARAARHQIKVADLALSMCIESGKMRENFRQVDEAERKPDSDD